MATNYSKDGTYWTGRDRGDGYLDVIRVNSKSGNYEIVEYWGAYKKLGSAVAAAAQLAYQQGRTDGVEEMRGKVQNALMDVGLSAMAVTQPDQAPDEDLED